MDEYIRSHRDRFTREAITAELEKAGHARADIDATWDRIAAEPDAPEPELLGRYAWIMYWFGAALIVLYSVLTLASGGVGLFFLFGAGWLGLYLALAYLPVRALAAQRMSGLAKSIALVIAAPLVVLLIGGGICFATIAAFVGTYGG